MPLAIVTLVPSAVLILPALIAVFVCTTFALTAEAPMVLFQTNPALISEAEMPKGKPDGVSVTLLPVRNQSSAAVLS